MADALPPALTAFLQQRLPRWRRLLQELIRIPSCFGREHAIVEFVAVHLAALGVPVARVQHDAERLRSLPGAQPPFCETPGRSSLVARVPGRRGGRSLAINTHLDVVPEGDPAQWRHAPYLGHVDPAEDVIYGRGAMDDKAGVALALALLEALASGPVRVDGDVVFHFVLEDETTGNGTLLCLNAGHRADAALILDGTRKDKAINEHAGNLQFAVQLAGRPASVSVAHLGVNAAELLARFLLRLRDGFFARNAGRATPWTRFPSPYQLVIHKVRSEGAQLTVPESAWAECYATFPPPDSLATVRRWLEEQATQFAEEHGLAEPPRLGWDGFATEPVRTPANDLETCLQASAADLGLPAIDVGPSTGTSDLRHFIAAGIPCLLYGPGSGFNPHRPDEHYHLADLPIMLRLYLGVIQRWCGRAASLRQTA